MRVQTMAKSSTKGGAKARSASKRNVKRVRRNRAAQSPGKLRDNIGAETIRESYRVIGAPFEPFQRAQVPDTLRALTERNVAQARELYESSKNTVQAVFESWQKSFGAAGQRAAALNQKVFDVTERNINSGFDFATDLAGARNFAEVLELQATYWRKILGEWQTQRKRSPASTRR
jgi:hypothetical protein